MTASPHPREFPAIRASNLLDSLEAKLRLVLKTPGAEQIHDLRVATRRFRQALTVFESSFRDIKSIHRQLKPVMKRLGEVRDLDIALKFLSDSDLAGAAKITEKLIGARAKSETRLTGALAVITRHRAFAKWRRALKMVPLRRKAHDDSGKIVLEVAKEFFHRGDKAVKGRSAARLHRARVATKKLRYTLELGAEAEARPKGKHDPIAQLQSDLGHIHDVDSTGELLAKQRGAKKILREARKKQRERIEEFLECWKKEFAGEKNRERWMQQINQFAQSLRVARERSGEAIVVA